MTFWILFEHFASKKIEMNPFSGSTNLWRLFGEQEPLNVLCRSCKGPLSGSYGSKLAKIAWNMTFWVLFEHFDLLTYKLLFQHNMFYHKIYSTMKNITKKSIKPEPKTYPHFYKT